MKMDKVNDQYKKDLLAMIFNPLNQSGFRFLSGEELTDINRRIAEGKIFNTAGLQETAYLNAGLIDEQGAYCARIESGIVWLIPSTLLRLKDQDKAPREILPLGEIKKGVQHFYESFGWKQTREGLYVDGARFEDNRSFVKEYTRRCNARVKEYLNPAGKYLLDAASGPIQHRDYLDYSMNFDYRVCVDISYTSLLEARRKLGEQGIYLLADLSRLPIRNETIGSAVSINALYHIPKSEQLEVMRELYRVLQKKGKGVIVYSNGRRSWCMNLLALPIKIVVKCRALLRKFRPEDEITSPELYFYAHPLRKFRQDTLGFNVDVRVWRFLSVPVMKLYFHRFLFGRNLLRYVFRLEQKFPSFLGKIGEYPLFWFEKN